MSDSERPTPIGEFHYRDTVEMNPSDINERGVERARATIYPSDGIFYWPEEETI
jgi:hypothetical protein